MMLCAICPSHKWWSLVVDLLLLHTVSIFIWSFTVVVSHHFSLRVFWFYFLFFFFNEERTVWSTPRLYAFTNFSRFPMRHTSVVVLFVFSFYFLAYIVVFVFIVYFYFDFRFVANCHAIPSLVYPSVCAFVLFQPIKYINYCIFCCFCCDCYIYLRFSIHFPLAAKSFNLLFFSFHFSFFYLTIYDRCHRAQLPIKLLGQFKSETMSRLK